MARSSAGILARLSRRSASPSARSWAGLRPAADFRSRAVAATAARSSSLKTLSSLRVWYRLFVVQRRTRLLQRNLGARLARDPDGQPAVVTLADVVALLEPELVDVEVERLLLVEDIDRGHVEPGDHLVGSPLYVDASVTDPRGLRPKSLLQNCSIAPSLRPPSAAASRPAGRSGARRSAHALAGRSTVARLRSRGRFG